MKDRWTRLDIRDAKLCAKADARFSESRDLMMDGDEAGAAHEYRIGWRLCRKAWAARAKRERRKKRKHI